MTDVVVTRGLVKRYPGTVAVAGLDLAVGAGEIYGLVGPNGAGKTTTLRILATLLTATSGHAEIAGIDVRRNPDAARRVLGFMPDVFGVYDECRAQQTDWLIRAAYDRRVHTSAGEESLMSYARNLPGMAKRELSIRDKPKGGTRQAKLRVGAGPVYAPAAA